MEARKYHNHAPVILVAAVLASTTLFGCGGGSSESDLVEQNVDEHFWRKLQNA